MTTSTYLTTDIRDIRLLGLSMRMRNIKAEMTTLSSTTKMIGNTKSLSVILLSVVHVDVYIMAFSTDT